jgi:hypothetical protein
MANDKKFIVKNGLQSKDGRVVIGTDIDDGSNNLQITGNTTANGTLLVYNDSAAPTGVTLAELQHTGAADASKVLLKLAGDASNLSITNPTAGDYLINNAGNGIKFYNDTDGIDIIYNNTVDIEFSSTGIDFKREPTYNSNVFWNAGNDGAGSGLDADVLDGLDSLQFVRSDQDDTMTGNYIITGNLTVQGTRTEVQSETVLIADNLLTLNSNFTTGTPTENAGWEVSRGSLVNSSLQWDETADWFKLISAGVDLGRIITTADEGSGNLFDADTVDGLEAEQFLRADADDTATGKITIEDRLTVGDGTGTAYIYMKGAGATGYIASTNGQTGFLNSGFNFAINVKSDGDINVRDNIFAQEFIDNNDNNFKVIPSGISVLNNIDLDGAIRHKGDIDTFIDFPAADRIGFTLGSGQYGLMTTSSFEYTQDIRAPRFVDLDDDTYLVDPAGTSVLNTVGIDSEIFHNGDTNTKFAFGTDEISLATGGSNRLVLSNTSATFTNNIIAPKLIDSDDNTKFVDPSGQSELSTANFYSGTANNTVNIGISSAERFNINVLDGQGYIRYIQDETTFTDHSVNFEINSSSTYPSKFKFNKDVDIGSNTFTGGTGIFTGQIYASKYWDSDDVTHYGDFGNSSVSLYFAGSAQGGIGSQSAPTFSFKGDTNTGMYNPSSDRLAFTAGNNNEFNIRTSYVDAPGSMRSPLFYDLDNSTYYTNPAGESVMANITIDDYIKHRGDTTTYMGFPNNDVITFVTNNTSRLNIDNDSADFSVNVYAPRFYDSQNNTYYVDPASTSIMNRIDIDDYIRHRGDENNYFGFEANDTFRVFTGGTQRLNVDNNSVDSAVNVFAPQYYTNDYLIHNGDTNTYVGFDAADQFAIWTAGTKRANFDSAGNIDLFRRTVIGNSLARPGSIADLSDSALKVGGSDVHIHMASLASGGDYAGVIQAGRESDNASFPLTLQPNSGNVGIGITNPGALLAINKTTAQGNNPFAAGTSLLSLGDVGTVDLSIRTDANGNIYYINDNSGDQIWYDTNAAGKFAILNNGNVVAGSDSFINQTTDATTNFMTGAPTNNIFHAGGSIAIEGKNSVLSIFQADGGDTAVNEATFLGVNELGFSAGGGFYMDDTTTIKIRGNKNINTSGSVFAGAYYDVDDINYYGDFNATSVMNRIDLDDYIRHKGDVDTYFGFSAANTFKVDTGGATRLTITDTAITSTVDVTATNMYAARFYDSPDGNYYLDPAGESQLNRVDVNDYIRHRGDLDTYFGFSGANTVKVFTGGTQRLNIDNDSADFGVSVYAPRYYDSANAGYYVDPASTSILNSLVINSADSYLKFGPGTPASDDAHIEWKGAANDGYLRISTSDDNGTEYIEFGDYATTDRTGTFTQWSKMNRDYLSHTSDIRAPIFYDSNNTGFYVDPASTSNVNVLRASQLQLDGSTYTIDSASGDYGSIKVDGAKGGYAGYVIRDDWGFISDGSGSAGIMNDTRNEWALRATDNNRTVLYANGVEQISAENGFAKAFNSMRAPIYYPPSGTTRFLDLDATNAANSAKIGGRILREGMNTSGGGSDNIILQAQDANHWLWNTATNWGVFWGTNANATYRFPAYGDNMLSFVGNGNTRMAFDLDSGDAYIQGELQAGNYLLTAGNEPISLNPAYGSGLADTKMFDGTMYWEKRMIQALQGAETTPTSTTGEWVKDNTNPGAASYVLQTGGYRTFNSDYIEVEPGEEIYAEIHAKRISGSGGSLYMGIRRYDKDKKAIATNDGIEYFVVGGNNVTSTDWVKFDGHTTIPTSHTVFSGSDGGGVKYVRLILLMNYNAGGAVRQFSAPIMKRTNALSRVRTDQAMYSPIYYDVDDTGFYLDPASTSKLNTVDASNFRDRDNTARFMNPNSGGNVQGTWNWNNGTIDNLNNLTFADPGPAEGIKWKGANEWQIYESPNDLTTNAGGNLQFTSGAGNGTMRLRVESNGDVYSGRYMRAQRFYDSNDGTYYADPASTSIFAALELRAGGLKLARANTNNAIWFNAGTDANHVLWNDYYGGPGAKGAASSGDLDGMKWNTLQGLQIRGGSSGTYNIAKFWNPASSTGNGHYVQLYANNVEQLGTRGGYGYAPNSMRSPLFYDQDDTTYFGDFAGTSRMNIINANMYSLDSGWDIYDDDGETLSIRSNNSDHGSVIFRDSGNTDCGRIYFDDDSHWGFKSPDNEWQIYLERNARTILYYNGTQQARTQNGYFEANNQIRSPIFYDSNDTAFYSDPNATSRIRGLTTLNVITSPGITGNSGSLRTKDNRIIAPNEDTAGEMKFGFSSWNNDNAAPYADYLHLRSYTDASGGSDNLLMFKKSGRGMRLWQQSWNSGTAYSAYSDFAIYNANPGGGSDMYASRYYDADDTSRYLDPASTSQLNTVRINGGNELQFTTSAGNLRGYMRATDTNDSHLQIATSGGEDIEFLDGGVGGQRNFLIRGDGNVFVTGTAYAQRFTDSNDGNYYGDFASTSIMNTLDVRGEVYNDGWFRNDTSGRGLYNTATAMHWMSTASDTWRAYSTANTSRINLHTAGDNRRGSIYANNSNEMGILSQDDGWALRTTNSAVDSHHNFYAPIMYDRDNSGYYVNPSSQSHMNTLTLAGNRIGFINSSFDAEIRVTDDNPDGTGATFVFYGDTVANNAEVSAEVFRGTRHMRAGRYYDIDNSTFFVEGASTSYFNSIQTDILYDRNNTGYYWNGASDNSTRFRGVNSLTMAFMALSGQTRSSAEYYKARPRITGDSNYWTGSMGWGRQDMNTVGNWGSGFIDSWSNPGNQPSGTSHWVGIQSYHYSNGSARYGWQMVGGPIENLRFRSSWSGFRTWRTIPVLNVNNGNNGAMYANNYYDTDNTGYYVDPSSFSNLNSGLRATEIYARNWFRNDNSQEGIYNQGTGVHAYSWQGQYYAITGNNNSSSMSLQLRATFNGTMCRWMYGDRTWSGDLNAAGQWQLQTRHQDGYSPTIRFKEEGNESWTGNIGNDGGKLEYHSNRFYIEAGGNSNRICQFRRNGSDRSYVDNNGLYVGTATSARWADLAERYTADDMYDNATVMGMNLDGDSEITKWEPGMPLVGVISTNPAVQMNDMGIAPGSTSKKARMNPFIALKGRIPCLVSEDVKKGQWVIPAGDGKAKGVDYGTPGINSYEIIGIALADSENGEVEVKV